MHTSDTISPKLMSSTLTTALIILVLAGDLYGLYLAATLGGVGWLLLFLCLPPAHLLLAAVGTWSLLFSVPAWFIALLG